MTHIFFVRHAQPDYRNGSDSTFCLSEEGMSDRLKAADALRDVHFDAAVSSPYKRSVDTIQPIIDIQGLELKTDIRLRERDKGVGKPNCREMFLKRWNDHSFCEEGGECLRSVQERNIDALNDILREYKNKTVLVGTHGTALSTILNYYDPDFGFESFMRIIDYMPYVLKLSFDGLRLVETKEIFYIEKEFHGVSK